MPRKTKQINITLLMRYLKPWMRETLKTLAEIDTPITTGELLDKLLEKNIEITHSQLLHYLKRLERHHIVKKYKLGYYRKLAWTLTDEIKKQIKQQPQT